MTFEGKFTASALASGVSVPSGEHFTTLIGAVHNGTVTFWSSGGTASAGIESMAEIGGTSTLESEINAAMSNALAVIKQSIASGGTATATVDITLTTDHPLVTLTSMVAPSPDWFVGVSGLSLRNATDDGWQPSLAVDLFPYDAGTEDGTEFSLSNAATSPQGTIASIKGTGKFSNEPIASLTFTLQSVAPEITSATTFTVDEGTTAVETLTATDQDSAAADLAWSKAGGADAGQFTLSTAGDLAFAAVKDYEDPDDADGDNVYEITVQVSDGDNTDTANLSVTLENVLELLTELTGPSSTDYAENGAVRVATYIASSEADRDGIAWQLGGDDAEHFSIDNPLGVLRFHIDPVDPSLFLQPPDFEAPVDDDDDNVYEVIVLAQGGSASTLKSVIVTVTDVDEGGTLTLSSSRPRLGTALTATLSDPDTVSGTVEWKWERSAGRNAWTVIDRAEAGSYTPTAADAGSFLRVTAAYTDRHSSGKEVQAVAPNVVLAHTLSRLEVTTSSSRSMYPAFDPEIHHYAVGCQDTLTLTLSTRETDTRLVVNGIQRANQNVAVELTGLAGGSDIPITLTGSEGASTTYVLHCLADDFPAIITEKKPGAWDGLITIGVRANPGSYLAIIDNNGVPRIHWWIRESVRIFRTHRDGRYPYSYGQVSRFLPYDQQARSRKVIVLDENLEPVDTVTTVRPLHDTDLHDFVIKSNGNYLLLAYESARRDMSQFLNSDGDPYSTNELTRDSVIQEVTPDKEEAFNWNSWDHMAVEDCTQHRFPDDYAHVNSVQAFDDDIVASFRGCSKVLRIDGDSGDVIWRLGKSNRSDADWTASGTQPPLRIVGDPYGEFCGQHSARMIGNGNLLLFDNGVACLVDPEGNRTRPGEDFSRVVEYAIDPDHGEAIFQRHYSYHGEFNKLAPTQSHIELLETGNWLISWGSMPVNEQVTEYSPLTGEEVLIIKLHQLGHSDSGLRTTAYPVSPVALADTPGPLTAEIAESPASPLSHLGPTDAPKVVVAFSRPVVDFAADTTSVSVTGATIASISPHVVPGDPANAYLFTLTPTGVGPITFALVTGQSCASDGICTAGGTVLSEVPGSHVIPARSTGPPVMSITSSATHPAKDAFTVTITFAESVTGLTANEIEVTHGTASNFGGAGAVYTLEIQPNAGIEDDVTVAVTGRPRLTLNVGGGNRTANYQSGADATLLFSYTVADGESDTNGVSIEADSLSRNGGTIQDAADNDALLDHEALAADSSHKVDGVKPELAVTGGAVVDGATLTLTWSETLDGSSTPETDDFTVAGGDRVRMVSRVAVSGRELELTLDPAAEHEEAGITVSYTPGMNPIRDVPGNEAEALSQVPVTNDTPDTTSPTVSTVEITSNPPDNRDTYAIGDVIEATVTFDETVEVEGTPGLRLRVGSRNRTAGYLRGGGTSEPVFGYEVALGDEDTDGVSIAAGRIDLNGGTIQDGTDNDAEPAHETLPAQAGHKVDGVRPEFLSAAVEGASLTLAYGEALDPASRPAAGDFTVEVGSSGRSVSGVSVNGSVVTLFLNPAVEHADTGTRVSYSPGARPLRDTVGNEAEGLSNEAVTNTTGAPNTVPVITSVGPFDITENQARVRRLAARDEDPGDELTGWEIAGGADQGQFTITSDTGELSFRTAPDFEAPGDNVYEVTVEVRSGAGARELEAEQTFTVRVTDEREPPGVPETPAFSGETAESLTVHWSEPDNTGPPIIDYDVQYREKGTGRFTNGGHDGPGLSLTLDDLEPGTAYEVQVRATNDEGRSDWSESGEGLTITPLTVQMASDIEPPVEGPFMVRFIFSEPVRGFSPNDIETGQDPACMDDQNTPVFCDPVIGPLETIDDRIFTASLTPRTDGVAHNYTLTLTVPTGRVSSLTGNKPNEEAMLAVRVAPPEVTLPISAIGLSASAGDSEVTLRWNRPANTGGSPIIRYEYRHAAVGEEWGDWEHAAAGARGITVENLINDQEYVFEARAVNALGKGPAETAMATPVRNTGPTTPPGPGPGPGPGPQPPPRPTVNTGPVITTPGPFEVTENQTRVVRIEAADADPGDAIRSYAIGGGADGTLFSIVAHTGVLSFREPPNFETPADSLSTDPPSEAGDNEYIVVVRVASGPLSRDRTVEQAFAVRVTDADRESPGVPGAPRVTLALDASLTVEWAEPENPGPPITGYDVQYREGPGGFFINAPHEGPGRTATLTGLEAATLYQVRVRARNEEGTGRWSEPGEGWTLAGPPAVLPFSLPGRGGISLTSRGTSPELRVGYGQVETDDGMTPPVGLAIFGSRLNGILVSEAGVPASAAVLEGRIFAETDGPVRTGVAMANPNDAAATVAFFFTDSEGIDSGHDTFTLEPREQKARFLDEAPFNGGATIEGTFTFTADLPVAVIALRGFVNERSEFLMTTLPVAPLAVPTTGTVYFPHFAAGGSWTTQVILVNPAHAPISGSVQFFGSGSQTEAAAPATLTLADGRSGSTFSYSIPPRSATRIRTSNPAGPLEVGSVRAVPGPGHPAPSGVSIFTFQKDGITVSEAGVPASTASAAFRVYVEASGTPEQPHSVRSGIALTNTSGTPTTVRLELTDLDGTATGPTESLTIPASGHVARFIDEFFPGLPTPFSGILRIASTAPDIAAVGLRLAINQRQDILVTTTPPVNENAAAAASGLFFPHFVDSGGWTTQFILFSGSPGRTASGMIRFTGQDGEPLELSVAPTAAPTIP